MFQRIAMMQHIAASVTTCVDADPQSKFTQSLRFFFSIEIRDVDNGLKNIPIWDWR